jgi:spore germination protein YaaH
MTLLKKLVFLLGIYSFSAHSFAQENLFYILRHDSPELMTAAQNSFASLNQHFKQINILVPQAYNIDGNGVIWGFIDKDTNDFAKQHSMKVMPLITNTAFDTEMVHTFLSNTEAQNRALQSLLTLCEKEHYYGLQFDFEMVGLADRDALTYFYQRAADMLHQKGFKISFAVAPLLSDGPFPSHFLKKIYVNWEGAYDLKRLAEAGDFLSIMAYNQHGGVTTPGPTAHIQWVEQAIQYALQYVPPQKISLGIPTYSTYWFTNTTTGDSLGKIAVHSVGINYSKAVTLIHKYGANLQWDNKAQLYSAIFQHDWLNEYIFLEDAKSFVAKLALAHKYHLRGVSVFDLGTEDPAIWQQDELKH